MPPRSSPGIPPSLENQKCFPRMRCGQQGLHLNCPERGGGHLVSPPLLVTCPQVPLDGADSPAEPLRLVPKGSRSWGPRELPASSTGGPGPRCPASHPLRDPAVRPAHPLLALPPAWHGGAATRRVPRPWHPLNCCSTAPGLPRPAEIGLCCGAQSPRRQQQQSITNTADTQSIDPPDPPDPPIPVQSPEPPAHTPVPRPSVGVGETPSPLSWPRALSWGDMVGDSSM